MTSDLRSLRKKIDTIDDKIILLLTKRMLLSKKIGLWKKKNKVSVKSNSREKEIILRLSKKSKLKKSFITSIYKKIFEESRKKQR